VLLDGQMNGADKEKSMENVKGRMYVRGKIPSVNIVTAYSKAFRIGGGWLSWLKMLIYGNPFKIADTYYQEADDELIRAIVDADLGDKEDYETEDYDCDDFAFRLMGIFHCDRYAASMPIFITWVEMPEGGHAVVSYINEHREVVIIEPQNDNMFPVPTDWKLQLLCG